MSISGWWLIVLGLAAWCGRLNTERRRERAWARPPAAALEACLIELERKR